MKVANNHLKKKKVLIQFSDGSSSYILVNIKNKEFSLDLDIKSNNFWKTTSVQNTRNLEERSIFFDRKFFNKKTSIKSQ